ncbi:MAG: ABC transporter permease [Clostridium sp.]
MNKIGTWFYFSCKRQFKRPAFLIVLLLLPIGMGLFHRAETGGSNQISIALFTEQDEWNESVAAELIREEHSFAFFTCDTREELSRAVASGKAECGYVFSHGLRDKLEDNTYKRSITVVTSPSTVAEKLASETVFAGLFRVYGRELLKEYGEEGDAFKTIQGDVWTELEPLYDKYLNNQSTFSFEYATVDGGIIEKDTVKAIFPIRGIAAIFILIIGLTAAVTVGEDRDRGLFMTVSRRQKMACMMAQLTAPVAFACASAFFCLLFTGTSAAIGKEIIALFLYGILTIVFSYLLLRIVKNPLVLAGMIPFFTIGSLVICPVFADLSVFIPALRTIRYFFLPYYYLTL